MLLNNALNNELEELKAKNLYRSLHCVTTAQGSRVVLEGREVLLFCSNNYLGLANHPRLIKASQDALEKYGSGSGASRLISGTMSLHQELEEKVIMAGADKYVGKPSDYGVFMKAIGELRLNL